MRKTPPAVNPTTDRRTAKIRTKSLIRKSRNRTQRELSPSYPPSDGESRIENGNLAAKRRRSAEKISKYGLPQQKRILPASGTLRRPARENPELCQHFPAKINFSPARNRQSLPPHSRRIQTIKGLRTQPTAGSVPARRKRLLRKPNLRSPPLPATDSPHGGPDRQPPTTVTAATAAGTSRKRSRPLQSQRRTTRLQRSFWRRSDPNPPPKKGLKRESALQTRPPAANERPSNDGH